MICYCQKCKYNSELSCTINAQINFEGRCAYYDEREIIPRQPLLNYCGSYWIPCEYATYNGGCSLTWCSKRFG